MAEKPKNIGDKYRKQSKPDAGLPAMKQRVADQRKATSEAVPAPVNHGLDAMQARVQAQKDAAARQHAEHSEKLKSPAAETAPDVAKAPAPGKGGKGTGG